MVLDGISLLDVPPRRLEELAGWIGNSAMQALLEVRMPRPEESVFRMPGEEPETIPFQVPGTQEPTLVQPVEPGGAVSTGAAADPAVFAV